MKVCKHCGSDKLSPSSVKYKSYSCTKCRNGSAAGKKARRKWMTGTGRGRHIRVGGRYYGYGKTAEQTQAIKQRGRELLSEWKQSREPGGTSGEIPTPEAAPN